MHKIIVQYKIDTKMSLSENLALRHHAEDILDSALRRQGLGNCDGGDIGNDCMNIWLYVKSWNRATEIIIAHLKHHNLLEACVVAHWKEGDKFNIVWPKTFSGSFRLMYVNENGA